MQREVDESLSSDSAWWYLHSSPSHELVGWLLVVEIMCVPSNANDRALQRRTFSCRVDCVVCLFSSEQSLSVKVHLQQRQGHAVQCKFAGREPAPALLPICCSHRTVVSPSHRSISVWGIQTITWLDGADWIRTSPPTCIFKWILGARSHWLLSSLHFLMALFIDPTECLCSCELICRI